VGVGAHAQGNEGWGAKLWREDTVAKLWRETSIIAPNSKASQNEKAEIQK